MSDYDLSENSISLTSNKNDISIRAKKTAVNIKSYKDTNIKSETNDINVEAKKCINVISNDKNVNVEAKNGKIDVIAKKYIKIRSKHGPVTVRSDDDRLNLETYKDMEILSEFGDITIEATHGTVNIKSEYDINIAPGSTGQVNVAGNLNATTLSQGPAGEGNIGLLVPPGSVISYCGNTSPIGWFLCDGSEYNIVNYRTLYDAIGTTFGGDDQVFRVPDMRGRVAIGNSHGVEGITCRNIGASGGTERVTLTENEIPSHSHNMSNVSNGTARVAGGALTGSYVPESGGGANTSNTGGGASHENMQPFLTLNYIIKY